jgi:hypothetical protein
MFGLIIDCTHSFRGLSTSSTVPLDSVPIKRGFHAEILLAAEFLSTNANLIWLSTSNGWLSLVLLIATRTTTVVGIIPFETH